MRRSYHVVLMLACLVFMMAIQVGAASNLSEHKQVVRVGYEPNYATIIEPAVEGRMGYCYDYLNELAKYTNLTFTFVPCNWNQGLVLLEQGELDLLGPMQQTPERVERFTFPKKEMGYEYGVLYASANQSHKYGEITRGNQLRVGYAAGSFYNLAFMQYCRDNDIGAEMIEVTATIPEVIEDLNRGVYDYYVTGSLYDIPDAQLVLKFHSYPFYFATTKGNTRLAEQLDSAMELLRQESPFFAMRLEEKYYSGKAITELRFTREEQALIAQYPQLTVACDTNRRPVFYKNNKTNQITGIGVELLEEISALSGLSFNYCDFNQVTSSTIQLSAGFAGDDFYPSLLLTDPYLTMSMVFASTVPLDTGDALRIACTDMGLAQLEDAQRKFPNHDFLNYQTMDEAVAAVRSGLVNATLVSSYAYSELVRSYPSLSLLSTPTDLKMGLSIGVSQAIPPLMVSVLNKSISALSTDKISAAIYKNTLNQEKDETFDAWLRRSALPVTGLVIIFALAFLGIVSHSNQKLRRVLYFDDVTGASSFTLFRQDAVALLQTAQPGQLMIASVDIENFKYINDAFGYEVGDQVLQLVSNKFVQAHSTAVLFTRVFADNFVFLGPPEQLNICLSSVSASQDLSMQVRKLLGSGYSLAFSCGTYIVDDPARDLSLMLDCANIARKSVKGLHGSTFAQYTDEMREEMDNKKDITLRMEAALENEEFVPWFQPKYDLQTGELIGAEVLVRWIRNDGSCMQPMRFIPLFEKNGFIEKIDLYMFQQVCIHLHRWKAQGVTQIPLLSVNLSKYTLYREDLIQELRRISTKWGISPGEIEIELTESLAADSDVVFGVMSHLKKEGYIISIDDFGSGYSSLNLLKDIPADVIKLDKSFLTQTHDTLRGQMVLGSIIRMAHELNLATVAEGIENDAQFIALRSMGCSIGQGYFFARPMPSADYEALWLTKPLTSL